MAIIKILENARALCDKGVLRVNGQPLTRKSSTRKVDVFAISSGFRKVIYRHNGTIRTDHFNYNCEHTGYAFKSKRGLLQCNFLPNGVQSFKVEPAEFDTNFNIELAKQDLSSYTQAKKTGRLYTIEDGIKLINYMLERKGAPTLDMLKNIFAQ